MKATFWLVVSLILVALLSACGGAPERNFSDQDLLVDVSVMPENWDLLDLYTFSREEGDNEEGEESGAHIIFYKTDTPYLVRGGQTVYRYSSIRRASWHYRRLEEYYFTPNIRETPPVVPEGFAFSSAAAAQWRFGCMDTTFSPTPEFGKVSTICKYIAQYDEFLVYVTMKIRVDDQDMASVDDVHRLVEAVDQRMAQYLGP